MLEPQNKHVVRDFSEMGTLATHSGKIAGLFIPKSKKNDDLGVPLF